MSTYCNECGKLCENSLLVDDGRMCKDCYIKWSEEYIGELRHSIANYQSLVNKLSHDVENAKEWKEQQDEIIETLCTSSSGDDYEMAEAAREIMEILDISCYRHGTVKSKLTELKEAYDAKLAKAKKIIKVIIRETWGEGWNYSLGVKVKAEQFLKEIE